MASDVRVMTAAEVAAAVPDGATVALTGSGIFLEADAIHAAIEARFLREGHPRGLTLVHALGLGDGRGSGIGRFAHEGLVARVIGGHWSWSPAMQRLAAEDRIEAWSFPAGVISTLLRESGSGRPGVITRIGLGTFADPRREGGRCNRAAKGELVELVSFDGREYLRYRPLRIDIAIVRATESDRRGNLSFRGEPADIDARAVALAAHNSGGRVYAQVERVGGRRSLPARLHTLPGILLDGVVAVPGARRTYLPAHDPSVSGEAAIDPDAVPRAPDMPKGIRRIIAERAAREIGGARSVNFGFGIPGGIPALLRRDGVSNWGSVEQGIHNGDLIDGPMFGAARDPDVIIPSVDQFDFYAGGGIDVAFLGMGEVDAEGNVNVSKIGGTLVGPGGFIDITQTARKVVFCGQFEAKGLDVAVEDGRLRIRAPGQVPKLVPQVEHVTFSGAQARAGGQEVIYVTERAVFRLGADGVELVELAPGIELQRDVLARMGFRPALRLPAAAAWSRD
jgi:acyl CoA:acetate/3-ketoacid CoA transferase